MTAPSSRAVVFDLDGTLADTMASAPRAYADTIRRLGGPQVTPSQVTAAWRIGPTPIVLRHFLGRAISEEELASFYERFKVAVADAAPFPGVIDMLRKLRRQRYRLGVVTAATRRAATLTLSATGLAGHFPVLIAGDDVAQPKPDPEGLHLACRRLGVNVTAAVYVGDALVDLQCADAAGALGVWAGWGTSATAPTSSHPIARRPGEVLELACCGAVRFSKSRSAGVCTAADQGHDRHRTRSA